MDKCITQEFLCSTHHCTDGKQSPDKERDLPKAFQPYHGWGEPASWALPYPPTPHSEHRTSGEVRCWAHTGEVLLAACLGLTPACCPPTPTLAAGLTGAQGLAFCCKHKAHHHLRPGVMIRIPPSAHQPLPSLQGTWDSSPHTGPGNFCWSWKTSWVFPSLRRRGVCEGFYVHCLNEFPQPLRLRELWVPSQFGLWRASVREGPHSISLKTWKSWEGL